MKLRYVIIVLWAIALAFVATERDVTSSTESKDTRTTQWTEAANSYLASQTNAIKNWDQPNAQNNNLPKNWNVFIGQNNTLTNWTSNEWLPDSTTLNATDLDIVQHAAGWDLVVPLENQSGIACLPIMRKESGIFSAEVFIPELKNVQFDLTEDIGPHPILGGVVHLKFYGDTKASSRNLLYAFIILLVAAYLAYKRWRLGLLISVVAIAVLRYLSAKQIIGEGLLSLPLFDPLIFASSEILPSLGDLVLHVITGVATTLVFLLILQWVVQQHLWARRIVFWLGFTTTFFLADMTHSLVGNLISNSNINFDVTHLSALSGYSVLATLIILTLGWMFFAILNTINRERIEKSNSNYFITVVLACLAFFVFQIIDANRTVLGLLPSIVFTLAVILFLWKAHQYSRRLGVYRYIGFLVVFAVFFTSAIQNYQSEKEAEYLNLYASKLISNKDLQAEYLFKDMENKLAQQFLVPEDFEAFAAKKDQFERRLRRLYFSGYLSKYNLLVLSFDPNGKNINSSTLYNFEDLDNIYNYKSFPTLSNHFYQVKSDRIFNGYLAKFENCDLYGHYGTVFILLEPKFIQSSYEYPQLVRQKQENRIFDIDDYAYALYSNGKLLNQKGTYPYKLQFDSSIFCSASIISRDDEYQHFVSDQEDAIVVLSHPSKSIKQFVSTFSFSFIFFTLLLVTYGLLWLAGLYIRRWYHKTQGDEAEYQAFDYWRKQRLNQLGIEQVYLSTRIRFAMIIIVFVGLLVSIYVTIQFIQINDQNRAENELMFKLREVANQLQNEVDFQKKLDDTDSRQLIVNEIGDIYKVDVNLFDKSGYLLASSIENVYQNGLIAPLMHPKAFETFTNRSTSQLLQQESIRDLAYTSAYLPLVNDKRKVIAYLNLPYYARVNELDKEISSYTVTFVNLYLFLILLAIALAYFVSQRISKPLQLIREKMSKTRLAQNELIEWKQNDEIGRLVKQYNKMVLELADSAEKLSASEREGAWKEMARQVAHEIKNPLTPMKLNIQHLQRAWADKNERLEDTFKRVTTVLIEQIDSLSKLATEFSSFAQMPTDNAEEVDLTQVLLNTITLFEKTENISFQYSDSWPSYLVMADKEQLGRVFNNIIKNAVQAIPKDRDGLIQVTLSEMDGKVEVSITDNGKGIPKEIQPKIFVPNFSTKNSGMGLGLAITKKMVLAANGSISFTTQQDKGTTFSVVYPTK